MLLPEVWRSPDVIAVVVNDARLVLIPVRSSRLEGVPRGYSNRGVRGLGEGKTFTDCSVRTYRWHTVLAVVFAPLDEANPLSIATTRWMLPLAWTLRSCCCYG